MEEKIQKIVDILKDMDDSDLIALWNERCTECNYMDDYIYNMCEFNDTCGGWLLPNIDNNPLEIIDRVQMDFDKFDSADDYFYIDGYGHYVSFHTLEWSMGSPFDYDELADAIAEDSIDIKGYDDLEEIMQDTEDDNDE